MPGPENHAMTLRSQSAERNVQTEDEGTAPNPQPPETTQSQATSTIGFPFHSQTQTGPIPFKMNYLEAFQGDSSTAREWLRKFDEICDIYRVDDDMFCKYLIMHLQGKASIWADTLQPWVRKDRNRLICAFKQRFIKDSVTVLQQTFLSSRQAPDEAVDEFMDRMIKLSHEAEIPPGLAINTIKVAFLPHIVKDVTLHPHIDSIESLRSIANTSESSHRYQDQAMGASINQSQNINALSSRMSRPRLSHNRSYPQNPPQQNRSFSRKPLQPFRQPNSDSCNRCGTKHAPRRCPAFNRPCFYCNIEGHFQIMCQRRIFDSRQNSR